MNDVEWSRSDWETLSLDSAASVLRTPASRAGKETFTMRAYRTESRYYFSSKQLLPIGSLVFFSDKIQRYVHPTPESCELAFERLEALNARELVRAEGEGSLQKSLQPIAESA